MAGATAARAPVLAMTVSVAVELAAQAIEFVAVHDPGLVGALLVPLVRSPDDRIETGHERHGDRSRRRLAASRAADRVLRLAHRPPVAERPVPAAGVVIEGHWHSPLPGFRQRRISSARHRAPWHRAAEQQVSGQPSGQHALRGAYRAGRTRELRLSEGKNEEEQEPED